MSENEKLQKIIARIGQGSRRKIENLIKQGRISVNGKVAILGDRINITNTTKICIDGQIVFAKSSENALCRVLVYYKPEGELCTRQDPKGRPTIFDRLPYLHNSRWISVGRLDINTSGLLLLTTDGELANRLTHPRYKIKREYAVCIFGKIDKNKQNKLIKNIQLNDGQSAFYSLTFKRSEGFNQWYAVTLTEGRNREVRRLLASVGVQISRLIRVRYGDITLPKRLPQGSWKELSLKQINYLRKIVKLPFKLVTEIPIKHDHFHFKTMQTCYSVNHN
ncbi:Ribosomal large subunit pseudouridine synthase B [Candidatus Gullanella endobia]|uniref:Pseudouridine synthase n=1 Tax=Candidatus Gullanella endobia TaxID=1070130 RepID=A0A143WQE6_9ENTR|nr:23S rRNA pseudouridine(2605) synthase RluB [Candidatus Gullanella endobia]CUX95965.1 Ribosomal large subunit pseudouridine synthase B [Candidatus Gullanella endobia]